MSTYNMLLDNVQLLLAEDRNLLILKGVTQLLTKVYEDYEGTLSEMNLSVVSVKEGKLIKCEVKGND